MFSPATSSFNSPSLLSEKSFESTLSISSPKITTEKQPLLPTTNYDTQKKKDQHTVIEYLKFYQSVGWLTMSGFGPPWALWSIFNNICITFGSETMTEFVGSATFFYLSTLSSFIIALGRTSVILKITFDREEEIQRKQREGTGYISHKNYWWCSIWGLIGSCFFEFGDGMGRIWAPASMIDQLVHLYFNNGLGLFIYAPYLIIWFIVALLSGTMRVFWWMWYWKTFSENDPMANAIKRAHEGSFSFHTLSSSYPSSSTSSPSITNSTSYHSSTLPSSEPPKETLKQSIHTLSPAQLLIAEETAIAKVEAFNKGSFAQQIYPYFMHPFPKKFRSFFKKIYRFLDGFGRTWAVFAVFNAVTEFVLTTTGKPFDNEIYFWVATLFAVFGGIYILMHNSYSRFKVFLH